MSDVISAGQSAPDFSMPANDDKTISLSDYEGRYLVLYFYPKDSTPGCTTEAREFTAFKADFAALNAEIVGVSRDSVRKHENFISNQELGITLGTSKLL